MHIFIHIHKYIHLYVYIYRDRQTERQTETDRQTFFKRGGETRRVVILGDKSPLRTMSCCLKFCLYKKLSTATAQTMCLW